MRAVWISLAVIVPAQVIVTYLQAVMGTAPVSVFDGAVILAIGAVFFSTIEIEEQTPDFARQERHLGPGGVTGLLGALIPPAPSAHAGSERRAPNRAAVAVNRQAILTPYRHLKMTPLERSGSWPDAV